MRATRTAITIVGAALGVAALMATGRARSLNHLPPARAPCSVLSGHPCHPSFCGVFQHSPCLPYGELELPETLRQTIVTTDGNDPYNKTNGDADKTGAESLNNEDGNKSSDAAEKPNENAAAGADHALDSIKDMWAALRDCWVPPPKDEARHGMEYTIRVSFKRDGEMIAPPRITYSSHDAPAETRDLYRVAIDAALKRCTPLHFSEGMGEAIPGRPITIRFIDDRTIDNDSRK